MTALTRLLVRLGLRYACCGPRIVSVPGWDRAARAAVVCGGPRMSARTLAAVAVASLLVGCTQTTWFRGWDCEVLG